MALLLGTAPNQVPTNGDLGTMAFQDEAAINVVNISYTGAFLGGTDIVNIGSGQVYKDATGNVGIGTNAPVTKLQVQGAQVAEGAMGILSQLISTTSYSTMPIAGLSLGTAYNSSGATIGMGGIAVGKENITDNNYASYLALYTRANGGATAIRVRIDSSGNLSATGTISPRQAVTASAPAYVKGAMYFDTTLNKLRIGGATAWETITSV